MNCLLIVDMNNGFAKGGALYSDRIEKLINPIKNYAENFKGFKIAFTDTHKKDSLEFNSYPIHCLEGTEECEVVEELKNIEGLKIIPKNSTNGFHEEKFRDFLQENPHIDSFEIVGCCTDICVFQLAISLKTFFIMNNKNIDIIVHKNMVDTFDILDIHDAFSINNYFFDLMKSNGIIVK